MAAFSLSPAVVTVKELAELEALIPLELKSPPEALRREVVREFRGSFIFRGTPPFLQGKFDGRAVHRSSALSL